MDTSSPADGPHVPRVGDHDPTAPSTHAEVETPLRLHRRFDRMGRLVGDGGMQRLFGAKVMVVGLGGVGSWTAEALARAGVGSLVLVDFDLVCVTNTNRQLHAMKGTTGKPKVDVVAERLRTISPTADVVAERRFYEASTSEALLAHQPDLVVDAIDNLTAKAHLIATCVQRGIPLVVSGGASGRLDPTAIRIADLGEVTRDPFVKSLRKILRRHHGFAETGPYGIPTAHSLETPRDPIALAYDGDTGFRCVCPQGDNDHHTCDERSVIYGTAGFVTGAFGFALAGQAVSRLVDVKPSRDF
jgi:tRNA A37 threonylcarbamoyladenosine dehydratase